MAEARRALNERTLLKERRKTFGYTQASMAATLDVSQSTYKSWEAGGPLRDSKRPALAEALDLTVGQLDSLLKGEEITAPEAQPIAPGLTMYASLEQGASQLWTFQPFTVPGLLQTPAYATAAERADVVRRGDGTISRLVAMRMARQGVLAREPNPLELTVVLDEAVLLRETGGPKVMAEQLAHMADLTTAPNVRLRVLPLCAGQHSAGFGFIILISPASDTPQMVCIEDRSEIRYLENQQSIDTHVAVFEHLTGHALSPGESVDLIRSIIKEKYT